MKKYNGTLMQPHTDFKLKFIAQTSGGNVGEAFRLPARKYHEFPLLSGEIATFPVVYVGAPIRRPLRYNVTNSPKLCAKS